MVPRVCDCPLKCALSFGIAYYAFKVKGKEKLSVNVTSGSFFTTIHVTAQYFLVVFPIMSYLLGPLFTLHKAVTIKRLCVTSQTLKNVEQYMVLGTWYCLFLIIL